MAQALATNNQGRPLKEGIEDLARQISQSVTKEQRQKVAVLPFRELQGQPTVLGSYLAEELTTRFYQLGNLEVFERTQLDKIMAEFSFATTGVIDSETAKQIGQLAGVDAIITGTITDFPSSAAVNCRIVDVQTGKILGAARTEFEKDDNLRALIGPAQSPTAPSAAAKSVPSSAENRSSGPPPSRTVQEQQYAFELISCEARGQVQCRLLVRELQREAIPGYCGGPPDKRARDKIARRKGRVHRRTGSDEGSKQYRNLVEMLDQESETELVVTFDGIPASTIELRLFEISASTYTPPAGLAGTISERMAPRSLSTNFRVVFRNVPIARK